MQIRIQNTIRFGEEMEIVDQYYQGEWKEKAGFQYLLYTNEEKEKVALKFSNSEMVMTHSLLQRRRGWSDHTDPYGDSTVFDFDRPLSTRGRPFASDLSLINT